MVFPTPKCSHFPYVMFSVTRDCEQRANEVKEGLVGWGTGRSPELQVLVATQSSVETLNELKPPKE